MKTGRFRLIVYTFGLLSIYLILMSCSYYYYKEQYTEIIIPIGLLPLCILTTYNLYTDLCKINKQAPTGFAFGIITTITQITILSYAIYTNKYIPISILCIISIGLYIGTICIMDTYKLLNKES